MRQIYTIAGNTLDEVIRQPIFFILLLLGIALILFSPYFTMFAMLANQILVKDMGLATLLLFGMLLAIFSATNVVTEEVENRTILAILSKPVSRCNLVVGKYLGLTCAVCIAEYLFILVLLQVVRTEITEAAYSKSDYPVLIGYILATTFSLCLATFSNFFYEKSFYSSAILFFVPIFTIVFLLLGFIGQDWTQQPFLSTMDISMATASICITLAVCLLCGISLAFAYSMSTLPALVMMVGIFLLGLFSDYILGRHATASSIYRWAYQIVPNLQIYLANDAVLEEREIPWNYGLYLAGYTVTYLLGILAITITLLENRETK